MADNLVLHVSNIPSALYEEDLVKDKLLIHFLRRSNGGNGEISIWYPTEEDGVALLTFDQQEVALRVLRRSHVLEIKQQSYPLEVKLLEVKQKEAERRKAEWLEVERQKAERLEAKRQKAERLKAQRLEAKRLEAEWLEAEQQKAKLLEAERLRTERMEAEQMKAERQRAKQLEAEQMKAKQLEAERLEAKQLEMNQLKVGLSQFSMPIRTKLSLQHFSDTSEVQKVIERHNLKCKKRNLELLIEGNFHDLSRCRDELYEKLRTSMSFADVDNHMTLVDQQNSEHNLKKEDHRQKAHLKDRSSSTSNQNTSVRMADQSSECTSDDSYSSDIGRKGRSGRRSPKTGNARSASGSRNLAFTITKPAEGLPIQSIQQRDTVTKSSSSQRNLKDMHDANACKRKPKETIVDNLPSSPKHPKNVCADLTSDQREYKKSATSSSNPASFAEASPSSSRSTADNSSRPTHSRNNPGQKILVEELFVNPAVLTYIISFKKEIIDAILSQANAQMNTENYDQVNKVILTAKSADLPEEFHKVVLEISVIFQEYQHCLRTERINLSYNLEPIKKEEIRILQLYLHYREIWSLPDKNILHLTGPFRDVLDFMVKWRAVKGNIRNLIRLVSQENAPNPCHRQEIRMDNLQFSTNSIVNEDKTLDIDSPSENNRIPAYNSGLSSDPAVTRTNDRDDFNSNSRNAKDTFTVNASTNKNTPRNQDAVDRNSIPKHSKDTTADYFTSKPQKDVDLLTKQTSSSSSMGARQSSSQSYTANLSAPEHSRNNLDHIPLSTAFFVDPLVFSYLTLFKKHEIDQILSQAYVEMRTEPGDEFTNIVLTAESPNYPERFYKAAREISRIFSVYERSLKHEKITLSNTSERQKEHIIGMLQSHLSRHHIWSSVEENILHLIGPSVNILEFKEKWRANKEDMLTFLRFVTERESRDPHLVEGINSLHLSTPRNDLTHDGQGHMARPASSSQKPGTGTRGASPRPNVTRNKTLPNHSK
ncbi:histone-lysine N-methyltransferase, H3 lysine-79 specific-like [Hyperolius riggenbachi]|uniref:histone-lysine N-methyltransferase, H3 lysine-79 specific-like n=1 Tax=Hyperolius riggenbachi TaxID=752182 RepID=UPI0035A3D28E